MRRLAVLYLFSFAIAGVVAVLGFTLARSTPSDPVLIALAVGMCVAIVAVLCLERVENVGSIRR